MSEYDPSADVVLYNLGPVSSTLTADVRSYNGGQRKLVLTRQLGKGKTRRLVALPLAEAALLAPLLDSMAEQGLFNDDDAADD